MKNEYIKSAVVHTVLFLLVLLFPFLNSNEEVTEKELEHVIYVDFSREISQTAMATPKGGKKAPQPKKASPKPAPTPKAPKVVEEKKAPSKKTKTYDNKNIPLPEKKNVKKKVVKPTPPKVKKVAPPQPTAAEIEAKKKAAQNAAKKSKFSALLSKSKKKNSPSEAMEGEDESEDAGTSKTDAMGLDAKGAIRGALGNRKVLKIPTIKDDSQKKGRVVVKICVNASGNVVSSEYTMMGSTTSDTYLIKLAEKGAKGYKFSPSSNAKECGKVTIEFLLK